MAYVGRSPKYGFLEGQTATFNGSTTVVTLQRSVSSTDALDVYIDNVHQEPDVAYNLSSGGSAITFTGTPANGQKLYIRFHGISFDTARASRLANTDADSTLTLTDSHTLTLNLNGTTALTATTSGITIPNLTVTGTTTSVNSTQLVVGDNQIILNSDVGSGVAPSEDAGIVINRGSSADVAFLWDEGEDYWLAADPIVSSTRLSTIKGGTTPTIAATTVGLFQSSASSQSAALSIIANSGQSSILNFGDENDENAGSLTYNHSSGTFALAGGSVTATGVTVGNSNLGSNSSHLANITLNNNGYIGSANASTALQIQTSGNAVFSGSVTATGLTVDNGSSGQSKITISEGGAGNRNLVLYSAASGTSAKIAVEGTTADLNFVVNNGSQTAITIDGATGNVGIGTSDPTSNYGTNLNVHSSATNGAALHLTDGTTGNANTDGFHLISTGGLAYLWNRESTDMVFATSNLPRMSIKADGKVTFSHNVKISGTSSYSAATLAEANNANMALQISPVRAGVNTGISIGDYGSISGIQAYNPANNASLPFVLNPFGGNVGIGTTSITNPYSQANFTDVNINGVWGGVISFKLGGATKGWVGQRSSGNGDMVVGATANEDLLLYANNLEKIRILSTGGITFNGDTAQANALSDYEEGTWNPAFNIPSGSVAYNAGTGGAYTKIGRMVHVNAWIYVGALSSPSGTLTVTLPFANAANYRASQVTVMNRWTGVTGMLGCWLSNNSQSLNFVTLNNGTMGGSALNGTNMQANCEMYLNFSYETA